MSQIADKTVAVYKQTFGRDPDLIVRSPGRINLLGEHTDYNEGFVLPGAIDRAVYLAVGERRDRKFEIHAIDRREKILLDPEHLERTPMHWPDYFSGVLNEFFKLGHKFDGVNCVFSGDLPIGKGLSSSAALEGAFGYALNALYELGVTPVELVRIGQRAENNFVGAACGVMDQYANIFGRRGHVIRLDCRSLLLEYYPFETKNIRIVLCDTGISHKLEQTGYNDRRRQCEEAVAILKKFDRHIKTLRDLSLHFLDSHAGALTDVLYRRSSYVVRENFRVLNGCRDLQNQDLAAFGEKMYLSHEGLKNDYEVSIPELDILVEYSREYSGVIGSRMMGGGFGGCTINLVDAAIVGNYIEDITRFYQIQTGRALATYLTQLESGVGITAVS